MNLRIRTRNLLSTVLLCAPCMIMFAFLIAGIHIKLRRFVHMPDSPSSRAEGRQSSWRSTTRKFYRIQQHESSC